MPDGRLATSCFALRAVGDETTGAAFDAAGKVDSAPWAAFCTGALAVAAAGGLSPEKTDASAERRNRADRPGDRYPPVNAPSPGRRRDRLEGNFRSCGLIGHLVDSGGGLFVLSVMVK
jgi:hypothetical protein